MVKLALRTICAGLFGLAVLCAPKLSSASDGSIVALTPKPSEHLKQAPRAISVQIGTRTLEKGAIRFVVDGRDVSDAITLKANVAQYKPPQPLAEGEHAVEIGATDAAGGRLSYAWTFTIDAGAAKTADTTKSPASSAASAPAQADGSAGASSSTDSSGSDLGTQDGSTTPQMVGQQNFYGGFSPIGGGPYYWGDLPQFEFYGVPDGYGFLTFSGIPGIFDLIPLGFGTFYATIPIPVGFFYGNPFITCHFFTPSGSPTVVILPSFPVIHHRRTPPPLARLPDAGRQSFNGASGNWSSSHSDASKSMHQVIHHSSGSVHPHVALHVTIEPGSLRTAIVAPGFAATHLAGTFHPMPIISTFHPAAMASTTGHP